MESGHTYNFILRRFFTLLGHQLPFCVREQIVFYYVSSARVGASEIAMIFGFYNMPVLLRYFCLCFELLIFFAICTFISKRVTLIPIKRAAECAQSRQSILFANESAHTVQYDQIRYYSNLHSGCVLYGVQSGANHMYPASVDCPCHCLKRNSVTFRNFQLIKFFNSFIL